MRRIVTALLVIVNLGLFFAFAQRATASGSSFGVLENCCEGSTCCPECCLSWECADNRGC